MKSKQTFFCSRSYHTSQIMYITDEWNSNSNAVEERTSVVGDRFKTQSRGSRLSIFSGAKGHKNNKTNEKGKTDNY